MQNPLDAQQPISILIVDDFAMNRASVALMLGRAFPEINLAQASDSVSALRMARSFPYDLIISEWMMPGPDGLALMMALREFSDLPFMLMAAVNTEFVVFEQGCDAFLPTPYDFPMLVDRVNKLLSEQCARYNNPLPRDVGTGDYSLYWDRKVVSIAGTEVQLIRNEARLLRYLMVHANQWLSPSQIVADLWSDCLNDSCDAASLTEHFVARLDVALAIDSRVSPIVQRVGHDKQLPEYRLQSK